MDSVYSNMQRESAEYLDINASVLVTNDSKVSCFELKKYAINKIAY
jgi:hypothetical protein